ncbi:hypothetical protein C8J57DRAFT_1342597 [Mycena rebaudengoi]|nr:hypothetical protein C8J57DRAFT_1342597 [Mycena rebaudengoi]
MLESSAITWMLFGCSVPLSWYTRGVFCALDRPSRNVSLQLKKKKMQISLTTACYSWLMFSMACPATEKQRDGQ